MYEEKKTSIGAYIADKWSTPRDDIVLEIRDGERNFYLFALLSDAFIWHSKLNENSRISKNKS